MVSYTLHHGDCLEIMPTLEAGSVDAIICDLPYGITACKWDSVIPLEPLWTEYKRLIKPRGAVVLFGSQPFNYVLWASNPDWFRYELIWDKVMVSNIANAKKMPLRNHENILVFGDESLIYNPQMINKASSPFGKLSATKSDVVGHLGTDYQTGVGYPKSILRFSRPNNLTGGGLHPTQKPVPLLEFLVKTYTNPGDLVLDNTFGSCTTGVACLNTGRRFIGIELDPDYFKIGKERMERTEAELSAMLPGLRVEAQCQA